MGLYYFYGVEVAKDRMVGYINSKDLIRSFDSSWIPSYQRDRITQARKINSLTSIYKNGQPIDSVKLNLKGEVEEKHGKELLLSGTFNVIDGQQRLWSLKDSNVDDYKMPVELYLNLPLSEEIRLFHQFNTDGTKLTFGELAKSYQGPMADLVRRLLKSKIYPIKFSVNSSKPGLTLSSLCPVIYMIHKKIVCDTWINAAPAGKHMKRFLQATDYTKADLDRVEFALRNLLDECVQLFGEYDGRATAYRRGFFLAWTHVMINNFLTNQGRLEFRGGFYAKHKALPTMLRNGHVKELVSGSTVVEIAQLYDAIIEHFNYKMKNEHLLFKRELRERNQKSFEELPVDDPQEHQAVV